MYSHVAPGPISTPQTPNHIIRVMLIDAHTMVRTGLRVLLEHHPGLLVVAETATRAEAIEFVLQERPDVVLIDPDLDGEDGVQVIANIIAVAPHTQIVLLTGLRDQEVHYQAILCGAVGLVMKTLPVEVIIKAIEKVYQGEVWLEQSMVHHRSHSSAPFDLDLQQVGDQGSV
jgi:DNA-binding NarL/FixJ family response regulator